MHVARILHFFTKANYTKRINSAIKKFHDKDTTNCYPIVMKYLLLEALKSKMTVLSSDVKERHIQSQF
jgi:hypothetical protein